MKTKQTEVKSKESRTDIGNVTESLSAPITRVYKVGGLELVFIFVGTLTMILGNNFGGPHSTLVVIVGAVIMLACLTIFAFRQLPSRQGGTPKDIEEIREFCARVEGEWWERVNREDQGAISFFRIEPETVFNSVQMGGDSYDSNGEPVAHWNSLMARVIPREKRILYLWEGWLKDAKVAHVRYHGFGEIVFEGSSQSSAPFLQGGGKFWNVNETSQETILKPFEVRRAEPEEIDSMKRKGTHADRKKLAIATVYKNWSA